MKPSNDVFYRTFDRPLDIAHSQSWLHTIDHRVASFLQHTDRVGVGVGGSVSVSVSVRLRLGLGLRSVSVSVSVSVRVRVRISIRFRVISLAKTRQDKTR